MSDSSVFLPVNWLGIDPVRSARAPEPPAGAAFLSAFHPLTASSTMPLPAIFSVELRTLRDLSGPTLLRDGIFPLRDFFRKHPRPLAATPDLFVATALAAFVPPPWRSRVRFYEIVRLVKSPRSLRPAWMGLLTFATAAQERRLRRRNPTESAFFWRPWSAHGEFLSPARLWPDFQAPRIRPERLFEIPNLRGLRFTDVSFDFYVADRAITHQVLSRGGAVEGVREVSRTHQDLPLSPFHALRLGTSPKSLTFAEHRRVLALESRQGDFWNFLRNQERRAGVPRGPR